MAVEQAQWTRVAVHPRALRPQPTDASRQRARSTSNNNNNNNNNSECEPSYLAQLEALLREHEPHKERQARELLRVYAGMERELLQCYRHHYTGHGGFRVAGESARHATVFSLPKNAIATYLREKLRARRMQTSGAAVSGSSSSRSNNNNSSNNSVAAACAKGDDVRSPEMLLALPTTAARHRNVGAAGRDALPHPVAATASRGAVAAVRPLPKLLCVVPRPAGAATPEAPSAGRRA